VGKTEHGLWGSGILKLAEISALSKNLQTHGRRDGGGGKDKKNKKTKGRGGGGGGEAEIK